MDRTWMRVVLVAALCFGCLSSAVAQQPADEEADGRERVKQTKPIGLFLTDVVLERFFKKVADDMAEDYGLDDFQRDQAYETLTTHVPRFLAQHRDEIQPLINEFFETQLSQDAPDPDFVAKWSKRVLPLLNAGTQLLQDMSGDMEDFMTDDQVLQLEGYMAAIDTATRMSSDRLHDWSDGNFVPERDWVRGNPVAKAAQAERAREFEEAMIAARDRVWADDSVESAGGVPPEGVAERPQRPKPRKVTTDEWDLYVERFVAKYNLDGAQQQRAALVLASQKKARDRYLIANTRRMEEIQKRFTAAKTPEKLKVAEAEYGQLMQQVERMFELLKRRLEKLPTRQQRKDAALRSPHE